MKLKKVKIDKYNFPKLKAIRKPKKIKTVKVSTKKVKRNNGNIFKRTFIWFYTG